MIKIGTHIGVGNTLLIIILTGVLGASLARLQGFLILRNIQDNLNRGIIPSSQLQDGLMILVGGILLLTPGFITDTLGLLLLLPWTRTIIKIWLKRKFEAMIRDGQAVHITSFRRNHQDNNHYDDIDIN